MTEKQDPIYRLLTLIVSHIIDFSNDGQDTLLPESEYHYLRKYAAYPDIINDFFDGLSADSIEQLYNDRTVFVLLTEVHFGCHVAAQRCYELVADGVYREKAQDTNEYIHYSTTEYIEDLQELGFSRSEIDSNLDRILPKLETIKSLKQKRRNSREIQQRLADLHRALNNATRTMHQIIVKNCEKGEHWEGKMNIREQQRNGEIAKL